MKRSFYDMIGVESNADQATIDTAYAQVMERLGESVKRGGNDAAMESQLVRDGYQILSDPAKRARYDAKLAAAASGVQLVFYPEDKGAQRKLGVQSVVFALLASTFCGVVYWQLTRKMNQVKVDYDSVVTRKQAAQNAPKVIDSRDVDQGKSVVLEKARTEPLVKNIAGQDTAGKQ
jgi:DnaJ-class molecular chaperone